MAPGRGRGEHFGGRCERRGFAIVVVLVALWALRTPCAAQASDMRVRIGAPAGTRANAVFVVDVLAAGTPVLIVPGGHPRIATLEVDGVVRQTAGTSAMIGSQPLGTTTASLLLDGVTPRSRVVVHVIGGNGEVSVAGDVGLLSAAARDGRITGMFLTFLLCIAGLHGVIGLRSRERTNLWYALWALAVFTATMTRDGFFGFDGRAAAVMVLAALVIAAASTGFFSSYLRLRACAPRLFWIVTGVNLVAPVTPALINAVTAGRIDGVFLLAPIIGIATLIPATVARWRAGFGPAKILMVGLSVLCATFCAEFFLTATGRSELVSDIAIDLATTFDFTIFAAAFAVRKRYVAHEQMALEAQLSRSEYDAQHDALTGLLNRRGLDAWVRDAGQAALTFLFIDLDHFKAVNDRGGHAAGDQTLRAVGRILRHAVRETDAVARVGGDEFIVAFDDTLPAEGVERVRSEIAAWVADLRPLGENDDTRIGASIGIGAIGRNTPTFEEALRAADTDAYRVKLEHHAQKPFSRPVEPMLPPTSARDTVLAFCRDASAASRSDSSA